MSIEEIYEVRVPKCYGNKEDDFHLRPIHVEVVYRVKELISALTTKSDEAKVNERAMALIKIVLGDKPLRCIYECETAKAAQDKLKISTLERPLLKRAAS